VFVPAGWPEDELVLGPEEPAAVEPGPLSPRQQEVVTLLAAGANVPQIAAELSLSEATVRTHLTAALRRLGARNRAHAVALAVAAGLVGEDGADSG
jgi:DNA-binding NarL/FixJ family response regulator